MKTNQVAADFRPIKSGAKKVATFFLARLTFSEKVASFLVAHCRHCLSEKKPTLFESGFLLYCFPLWPKTLLTLFL